MNNMNLWESLVFETKIGVLEVQSTVMAQLLLENTDLVQLVRNGASFEDCLEFINNNW